MKDTTTLLVLMLATLATGFIASAAYGQDITTTPTAPAEKPAMKARAERHAEMLARFDADKDGKLDETERAALREAVKNGDVPRGQIHGRLQGQHRRIAAWIENHPEEARRIAQHARARMQQAHKEIVARYDTDGDHKLNETERAALRADVEAGNVPPRMARALKRAKEMRQHQRNRGPRPGAEDVPPPPAGDEEPA